MEGTGQSIVGITKYNTKKQDKPYRKKSVEKKIFEKKWTKKP